MAGDVVGWPVPRGGAEGVDGREGPGATAVAGVRHRRPQIARTNHPGGDNRRLAGAVGDTSTRRSPVGPGVWSDQITPGSDEWAPVENADLAGMPLHRPWVKCSPFITSDRASREHRGPTSES